MAGLPPTVQHTGFLVPNAGDVVDPKMAEPDRIDFNTLGNARWGVIEGCRITVTGQTASLAVDGTAIVNGSLITVRAGTASLGAGGAEDRFDLVCTDSGGALVVAPGTPSADPVFPDPGSDRTVLAAVLCRSGVAVFDEYVIDKRNMLRDSILTRLSDPTKPLVLNRNGAGDLFKMDGNGLVSWHQPGDTSAAALWRAASETLRLHRHLQVVGDLSVGEDITAASLAVTGLVSGSNLQQGITLPPTANNGDLFQSNQGRIYVWTANHWEELVTASGAVPVGAVINSLEPPSVMVPLGWVPLDGSQVTESAASAGLFNITALQPYISGSAPNRVLTTPNATRRHLLPDFVQGAGVQGGTNQVVMTESQMFRHKHNTVVQEGGRHNHTAGSGNRTGRSGEHAHQMQPGGGRHHHPVTDPGHRHQGMDYFGFRAKVIAAVYGGSNKIDAEFNDRSHTYSVEALDWVGPNTTGISIGETGSEHAHVLEQAGDHDHPVALSDHTGHPHTAAEEERGGNEPIDVTGAYLTMYCYVRS